VIIEINKIYIRLLTSMSKNLVRPTYQVPGPTLPWRYWSAAQPRWFSSWHSGKLQNIDGYQYQNPITFCIALVVPFLYKAFLVVGLLGPILENVYLAKCNSRLKETHNRLMTCNNKLPLSIKKTMNNKLPLSIKKTMKKPRNSFGRQPAFSYTLMSIPTSAPLLSKPTR